MTAITDKKTILGEHTESKVSPHETKAINNTEVGRAVCPNPD